MKNIVSNTRLRDLREDKDLSQEKISKLLNITQAQYSRIENDEYQLSYDSLIKLATFYNTSIDYILKLTNEIKPYPKRNTNNII